MTSRRPSRREAGHETGSAPALPEEDDVRPDSVTSTGGKCTKDSSRMIRSSLRRSVRHLSALRKSEDPGSGDDDDNNNNNNNNDDDDDDDDPVPDESLSGDGHRRSPTRRQPKRRPAPLPETPLRTTRRSSNNSVPFATPDQPNGPPPQSVEEEDSPSPIQVTSGGVVVVVDSPVEPVRKRRRRRVSDAAQAVTPQNSHEETRDPAASRDDRPPNLSFDEEILGPGIGSGTAGLDYGSYGGQSQGLVAAVGRTNPDHDSGLSANDAASSPARPTRTATMETTTTMNPTPEDPPATTNGAAPQPAATNPIAWHQPPAMSFPMGRMHPWWNHYNRNNNNNNPMMYPNPPGMQQGWALRSRETTSFVDAMNAATAPPYWTPPTGVNPYLLTRPVVPNQAAPPFFPAVVAHHTAAAPIHATGGALSEPSPAADPAVSEAAVAGPRVEAAENPTNTEDPAPTEPLTTADPVLSAEPTSPVAEVTETSVPTEPAPTADPVVSAEAAADALTEAVCNTEGETVNTVAKLPSIGEETPDPPLVSSEEVPKLPVIEVERTGVSLEATELKHSMGLTREVLNQHIETLGLSAKFCMSVIAKKGMKLSHLTFNDKWNDLPHTEKERLQFWLGHGKGRLNMASPLDPAKQSQEPIPMFWAVVQKGKGGALCHYVGHFKCVKFEINNEHTVLFKRHDRQALIEFEFVTFDSELAAKMAAIDPIQTLADIAAAAATKAAAKAAEEAARSSDAKESNNAGETVQQSQPHPEILPINAEVQHAAMIMNDGTSLSTIDQQLSALSLPEDGGPPTVNVNVNESSFPVTPTAASCGTGQTPASSPSTRQEGKKRSRKHPKNIGSPPISLIGPLAAAFLVLSIHSCSAFLLSPSQRPVNKASATSRKHHLLLATESTDLDFPKSITATDESPADSHTVSTGEKPLSRSAFLATSWMAALAVTTVATVPEVAQAATLASSATQKSIQNSSSSSSTSSASSSNSQTTLEESISGFLAGAALSTTKTVVKYPLDTATVRLQMPASQYSIYEPLKLMNGSFRGITTPLVSNIPAGAVFFAVKDATKQFLKSSPSGADLPRWASTSLAVLAATFPYMAIRNPSEVIKTRLQAGVEGYGENVTALEAFQKVRQGTENASSSSSSSSSSMVGDFYVGYWENVCYTYPADVLKFVAYENFSGGRKNLQPAEGALYGAAATAVAQFWTTPLDVVRNRAMAQTATNQGMSRSKGSDDKKEDPAPSYLEKFSKIAKEEGMQGLFAGVSPRVGKAILSGAIQFATYEETKQVIANAFQNNKNK